MENKVLVFIPFITKDDMNYRLLEMSGLLDSLMWDAEFIGFKINVIRHGTYFNEDRIDEIKTIIKECLDKEINIVSFVVDVNLSGTQVSKLEELLGIPVIDKTNLILQIFKSRATSKEAKLQVEIATLQYQASQLVHTDADYSQVTSGSG